MVSTTCLCQYGLSHEMISCHSGFHPPPTEYSTRRLWRRKELEHDMIICSHCLPVIFIMHGTLLIFISRISNFLYQLISLSDLLTRRPTSYFRKLTQTTDCILWLLMKSILSWIILSDIPITMYAWCRLWHIQPDSVLEYPRYTTYVRQCYHVVQSGNNIPPFTFSRAIVISDPI